MTRTRSIAATAASVLVLTGAATANPVQGFYFDVVTKDNHGPQIAYDELGTGPLFPQNELIIASVSPTMYSPSPLTDNGTPSALIRMTNLTGQSWTNLYYVADPETSFTNVDGVAASVLNAAVFTPAFRIDAVGLNTPLVSESIFSDGIFQPFEVWEFVIQNYTNAFGLSAADFGSLDFAGGSMGDSHSSGSIIAMTPVPTPGAMALFGMCGVCVIRRRR